MKKEGNSFHSYTLYSLKLVPPGEKMEVVLISQESPFTRRLSDLGLREGALIEVINRDPLARKIILKIGENFIALDEDLVQHVMVKPLVSCYQELKERVYYDILTGCCKRDFAENLLERLVSTSPCSLALGDLDNFKYIQVY